MSAIYCVFLLTSCTQLVYSHDDYINRFKTKQAVMDTFGQPSEKREGDSTMEWLYDYSNIPKTHIGSVQGFKQARETKTVTLAEFSNHKKYVIFTFNKEDSAISAAWRGVDFSRSKRDTTATIIAAVLGVGILFGIGALAVGSITIAPINIHW